MTITRRPPRQTRPAATPAKKTPESFIDSAQHPVLPVTGDSTDAEKAAKKAKDKEKDKEKSKDKAKGKEGKEGKEHKKRKDKEAVLIRFEDDQLTMMDERAAALGLSRAAWLRMIVAKALMIKDN